MGLADTVVKYFSCEQRSCKMADADDVEGVPWAISRL